MIEYALNLIMKNGMDGIVSNEKSIEKQVKFYNGKVEIIKDVAIIVQTRFGEPNRVCIT